MFKKLDFNVLKGKMSKGEAFGLKVQNSEVWFKQIYFRTLYDMTELTEEKLDGRAVSALSVRLRKLSIVRKG
jgi:hypothetical protein